MLMDMIGILIGFSLVMLILSLIVTGLVEATQHVIRLRAANLRNGLIRFLNNLKAADDDFKAEDVAKAAFTNANPLESSGGTKRARFVEWMLGTPDTWVNLDQLANALPLEGVASRFELKKKVSDSFAAFEMQLSRRYRTIVRYITLVYALGVAVVFQVSALNLLEKLYDDAVFREGLIQAAEQMVSQGDPSLGLDMSAVADSALVELERLHPELSATFEEASGVGDNSTALVSEMQLILDSESNLNTAEITDRYAQILERLEADAVTDQLKYIREKQSELAELGITPWSEGGEFYRSFRNILGVLITALLLTFGAPTWFRVLSGLINLRNVLTPKKKDQE